MKTSEFKKRLGELGYFIAETGLVIDALTLGGEFRARVCIVSNLLKLNTVNLELAKLCIEYAETPLSEREDEKKYRVRIPDSPERTPVYALCKLANGCVVINQTNENNFQEHDRYKLTEAEIKRNHEYLWQFAKEVQHGED